MDVISRQNEGSCWALIVSVTNADNVSLQQYCSSLSASLYKTNHKYPVSWYEYPPCFERVSVYVQVKRVKNLLYFSDIDFLTCMSALRCVERVSSAAGSDIISHYEALWFIPIRVILAGFIVKMGAWFLLKLRKEMWPDLMLTWSSSSVLAGQEIHGQPNQCHFAYLTDMEQVETRRTPAIHGLCLNRAAYIVLSFICVSLFLWNILSSTICLSSFIK